MFTPRCRGSGVYHLNATQITSCAINLLNLSHHAKCPLLRRGFGVDLTYLIFKI